MVVADTMQFIWERLWYRQTNRQRKRYKDRQGERSEVRQIPTCIIRPSDINRNSYLSKRFRLLRCRSVGCVGLVGWVWWVGWVGWVGWSRSCWGVVLFIEWNSTNTWMFLCSSCILSIANPDSCVERCVWQALLHTCTRACRNTDMVRVSVFIMTNIRLALV